jgi:hypothetical protein
MPAVGAVPSRARRPSALLLAEPFDGAGESVPQRHLGSHAEQLAHLGVIRHAPRDILVAASVHLFLRHELDLRSSRPIELDHQLGEFEHRGLDIDSDIDRLTIGGRIQAGLDRGGDRVADIGETARLAPISDHGEIRTAQQLAHEDRKQAANVELVQPRAVNVEVAHHRHRQAELVVGEAKMLADRLGGRVAPAIDRGGAEHPVVVFLPRNLGIAPVDFGGGAQDQALAVLVGGLEEILSAVDVYVEGLVRIGDVMVDPDHRRQMVDEVGLRRQAVDQFDVEDGVVHVMEARVTQEMTHFCDRAGVEH